MKDTVCFTEVMVHSYQTILHHIQQDINLDNYSYDELKSDPNDTEPCENRGFHSGVEED